MSKHKCDGVDLTNFFYCLLELADHHRAEHGWPGTTIEVALKWVRESIDDGYLEAMAKLAYDHRTTQGAPPTLMMKAIETAIESMNPDGPDNMSEVDRTMLRVVQAMKEGKF